MTERSVYKIIGLQSIVLKRSRDLVILQMGVGKPTRSETRTARICWSFGAINSKLIARIRMFSTRVPIQIAGSRGVMPCGTSPGPAGGCSGSPIGSSRISPREFWVLAYEYLKETLTFAFLVRFVSSHDTCVLGGYCWPTADKSGTGIWMPAINTHVRPPYSVREQL